MTASEIRHAVVRARENMSDVLYDLNDRPTLESERTLLDDMQRLTAHLVELYAEAWRRGVRL